MDWLLSKLFRLINGKENLVTKSECVDELSKKEYIACKLCNQLFHKDHVNLPGNILENLKEIESYFVWICEECKKSLPSQNPNVTSDNSALVHLPQIGQPSVVPDTSTIVPSVFPSNPALSSAAPSTSSLSGKEAAPLYSCDTRVKIVTAGVVNVSCEKDCKHECCDGFSGSHSETNGRVIKEGHSRNKESNKNENILINAKSALKSRLGRTEAYITTISSDGKTLQYPIQDHFAQLKVEEKSMLGSSLEGKFIAIQEIFHTKNEDGIRVKKNILITGDAGFGKTTLAIKLCYDWATLKPPNYISDFELVVNIPLRKMENEPIQNIILNEMHSNGYQKEGMSNGLKVLVILDGFDEIGEKRNVVSFLEDQTLALMGYSICMTVIVTSRPYAVEEILPLFDRHLSISGLTYTNQNKHIKKILPHCKATYLTKDMVKHPFLRKLSECPLILHLLCCVYANEPRSTISSRTEIYLEIFKLLTLSYASKNEGTSFSKRLMKTKVLENEIFIRLGRIVSDSILKYERITEDSLTSEFQDKEELEFIHGLGIMVVVPISVNMRAVMTYECLHLTFAEFLASIYFFNEVTKPEPHLKALSICTKRLKTGFIAGLLGEKFLDIKTMQDWITKDSLTFSELHQIKSEACLSEHSWKSFCSSVKSVEYDPLDGDSHSLSSETTLPNLSEIKVKSLKPDMIIWERIDMILTRFKTCTSLIIDIATEVYYLPGMENYSFCLMDMLETMTGLIKILKFHPDVTFISVYIHPEHVTSEQIGSQVTMSNFQDDSQRCWKRRCWDSEIGIFPTEPPIRIDFDSKEPQLLWKWKFDSLERLEIRYNSAFNYGNVDSNAIPIISIDNEHDIDNDVILSNWLEKVDYIPLKSLSAKSIAEKYRELFGSVEFLQ